MSATEFSKTWLGCFRDPVSETAKTPAELACAEAEAYFGRNGMPRMIYDTTFGENFQIIKDESGYTVRGGETGLLYGVYALIMACENGETPPSEIRRPSYPMRVLSCWDNMDGSVERGYSGRSIWFENGRLDYDEARIRQLGRMLASVDINTLCINNVNVHDPAQELTGDFLPELAKFAELLRPFAVRLMLSVDFSMPLRYGLDTADPLDENVQLWWAERAKAVWQAVPDLAGFMVKADSEHRPGPNAYGRTHAEGANMLARAVAPYGGTVIWRAFVYDCMQDWRNTNVDRPKAAYELYKPLDGCFDMNVILQVKHGPFDFQVREPVSPLLLDMPHTRLAMELQLAQEYTGQQIDIYAMPPMWKEVFDVVDKRALCALTAVSNLGRDANWTGHPFAALNLFVFGCFAWDPDSSPETVIRRWARLSYKLKTEEEEALTHALLESRSIYEQYTAPLGLCWMVQPNTHYGPNPWGYEFQAWGTYNRADRNAVGIDRTGSGTDYVSQYPPELKRLYEDAGRCPDELLLFFYRLPYNYIMRDGRTLIQRIYDDHFEGCERAEAMAEKLLSLHLPEEDARQVRSRMEAQIGNAREWRDVTNTFFHRLSGIDDIKHRLIYE